MVMLHADQRKGTLFAERLRGFRGEIIRMQVTYHRFRSDVKHAFKMPDLLQVMLIGFSIFQISDMLAQKRVFSFGQAGCRLLFRPAGKHAVRKAAAGNRVRHIASAPPVEGYLSVHHRTKRVVTFGDDVTVVQQESVRNAFELFQRLFVAGYDRRLAQVRACHHQHIVSMFKQQIMQGCIREHHSEHSVFAQMSESVRCLFFLPQQHNRPLRAGEHGFFLRRQLTVFPHAFRVPAHNGKGFFIPLFSFS